MIKIPPITSIRAFEVAARRLSFTKAAEELHITQSAVSKHIRHLEEWLRVSLFIRKTRSLALTPEGERYQMELSDIFQRMAWATERAMSGKEVLHLHSYTTFAMHWLIPRMKEFQDNNPEIELQLTASTQPIDTEQEHIHAVIRTMPAGFESSYKLFPVSLIPVCAPTIADRLFRFQGAAGFNQAIFLHSVAARSNWRMWLDGAGFGEFYSSRGLHFESSAMTQLAAEKGLGVAVAQPQFISDALNRGALVTPFEIAVDAKRAYYLSCTIQPSKLRALRRFSEWIMDAVKSDASAM